MSVAGFNIEDIAEARLVLASIGQQIDGVVELYARVAASVEVNAPSWRGEDQVVFVTAMTEYAEKAKKIAERADILLDGAKKIMDKFEAIDGTFHRVKGIGE